MSSDLLRRAADRLDELAGAATPGPWGYDGGWNIKAPPPDGWEGPYIVGETSVRSNAAYIAALAPNVGTALAELLNNLACDVENYDLDGRSRENAEALARQILGPDAA